MILSYMKNIELDYHSKKCALQIQALGIWASLSLPSIFVTLILYIYPESDDDKGPPMNDVHNFFQDFYLLPLAYIRIRSTG